MKKPVYHISQTVVKTKVRLKNVIVDHLDLLINQIQEYERQIQKLMDDSPHGDIFRSLLGADYILGVKLLVIYSTRDFSDAGEVQQLFGTAPYTAMSGQSRYVGFRRGASKPGRNTFQHLARGSIRSSPGLRSSMSKNVTKVKDLIMLTVVLPTPGSRSLLPCGVPRLLMMKAETWLLLPIILSISLLL